MSKPNEQTAFSKSKIWQLQREYFDNKGIDAWRTGEVPHYLTSNPVVGKTYAELVLALLRDLSLQGKREQTVYLLELGAGHGRLCYHFLKHFEKYYEGSAIDLPPICYIISDFASSNIDFCADHARLQPYIAKGWLDFALFDVEHSEEIVLLHKEITLSSETLQQPLVVIANYLFDSIPQELFYIDDGSIAHVLVGLDGYDETAEVDVATQLEDIELRYSYEPAVTPLYAEDPLNNVLASYSEDVHKTHLLFPHIGLRCLHRLRQLSTDGLVLLTADKGRHELSDIVRRTAPALATHGSFSLTVNYHAFIQLCEQQGGITRFPRQQHRSLDLGLLLFVPQPDIFRDTLQAYDRFVGSFGPDDYFSLKKLLERHIDGMTYRDMIAIIRLSGYDGRIFGQLVPRLTQLIPSIDDDDRLNLLLVITQVWDMYYPLGEKQDFALDLGDLLFSLRFFEEAILYYEKSTLIYGWQPNARLKIALCHCMLQQFADANTIVQEVKTRAPDNKLLENIMEDFSDHLTRNPLKL